MQVPQPRKVQRTGNTAEAATQYINELSVQVGRERRVQALLEKYKRESGGTGFWEEHMWLLALEQHGWVCLLPQQFMPLSENSGDLHCPPEHMVGTTKHTVREHLLDMELSDPALWKGLTYQDLIDQVVHERGNGERGLKHIRRSVEKWPHVAAILAAEKTETLQLRYTFGDGGSNERGGKREVHEVQGTAGEWIPDTKWT